MTCDCLDCIRLTCHGRTSAICLTTWKVDYILQMTRNEWKFLRISFWHYICCHWYYHLAWWLLTNYFFKHLYRFYHLDSIWWIVCIAESQVPAWNVRTVPCISVQRTVLKILRIFNVSCKFNFSFFLWKKMRNLEPFFKLPFSVFVRSNGHQ